MAALDKTYSFASDNDHSPWDTLQRLADEVGWELDEPTNGVVTARTIDRPSVGARTRGRIMASDPVPSPTRLGASRAEYMRAICASAGISFRGPHE